MLRHICDVSTSSFKAADLDQSCATNLTRKGRTPKSPVVSLNLVKLVPQRLAGIYFNLPAPILSREPSKPDPLKHQHASTDCSRNSPVLPAAQQRNPSRIFVVNKGFDPSAPGSDVSSDSLFLGCQISQDRTSDTLTT